MSSTYSYDWFTGPAFEKQKEEARRRCARKKFPDVKPEDRAGHTEYQKYLSELEVRTLIYLRDGFSYEMRELVDAGTTNLLVFECEPVDEQYKVGAFVVSTLFDEVVRIEVFAVHSSQKPEDMPLITGFRSTGRDVGAGRDDSRDTRDQKDIPGETD